MTTIDDDRTTKPLERAMAAVVQELEEASEARDRAALRLQQATRHHTMLHETARRMLMSLDRASGEAWTETVTEAARPDGFAARFLRKSRGPARTPPFHIEGTGRLSRNPRMVAVRQFLALEGREAFRVFDLHYHLLALGFDLPKKYAANACRRLAKQHVITRIDHAQYAINRAHPTLVETEYRAIQEGWD
ncbi:MAG: hypothetical protein AAGG47_12835 [Pseudomonadota bacterium]